METAGLWTQTWLWIIQNTPSIYAGASAVGISSLMDIRNNKSLRQIVSSACICGLFGTCFCGMLQYFGFPGNSAAAFGAVVGFIGADKLHTTIVTLVDRKTRGGGSDESK